MRVETALFLKFLIGVTALGICDQVVPQGVPYRIGEGGFFTHQDTVRDQMILSECIAKQEFSDSIGIHFTGGIDMHDVIDKVKISKGNPGLQGVDGELAAGPQYNVSRMIVNSLGPLQRDVPG